MAKASKDAAPKQPVDIRVSDIISMLNNGQDRRAIAAKYGVTLASLKELFKHPKLANIRVKPRVPINLIDDTEDAGTTAQASASAETAAPTATPEVAQAAAPQPQAAAANSGQW